MRDYSFGNFISALRERQGLSQYQLGALVGVSDKAVSKWENGASVPRIGTIKKLSEVLEVSVDELLTCEYAAFDKKRKDLFAMKHEIINLAKKKMKELYGENPPLNIVNRFNTEELMLKEHEMLLWMGFFGKLKEEFRSSGEYFEIRGAQMGASFIAWLLGGTEVNPLEPHYYCPKCRKIEFVTGEKCGVDLPETSCSCGGNYKRDGFGISEMNMYPLNNYNEICISENATAHVKKCLMDYFDGYGKIREVNVITDDEPGLVEQKSDVKVTKYVILSNEMSKKYPDGIINIQIDSYYKFLQEQSMLMTIESKNNYINIEDLLSMVIEAKYVKAYFKYAVENGVFAVEYLDFKLDKVLKTIDNPKFSDLLSIYGFLHGTNVWTDNAEVLFDEGISLSELIYCREDVYAYIYDKLKGKCCDNPSGIAYEIKEKVRRGMYINGKMPVETENLLQECGVPKWYIESIKKIRYLFPKTNLIVQLKRNICIFLKSGNGDVSLI